MLTLNNKEIRHSNLNSIFDLVKWRSTLISDIYIRIYIYICLFVQSRVHEVGFIEHEHEYKWSIRREKWLLFQGL